MARYTDEDRSKALALYTSDGLPAAHKTTGIPKQTITRWADRAGVMPGGAAGTAAEQTKAATDAHRVEVQARTAQARADLIPKLALLAHRALDFELEIIQKVRAGENSPLPDGIRLRDIVGSRTRAVHDLSLLMGEATERTENTHAVFLAPRPDRRNPHPVVDLSQQTQHTGMPQIIEGKAR